MSQRIIPTTESENVMNKKLLFVYNPRSGKQAIAKNLHGIIDIFTKAGYDAVVHPTQSQGDCLKLVGDSCLDYDLCVVSGGDGTLNEAINGMISAGLDRPYAYIPCGSTNDFSHSVGIPRNTLEAAKVAVSGKPFAYDIGKLNERCFTYVAAFGTIAEVSYSTSQEAKNALGFLAYVLEGIAAIGQMKSFNIEFECAERSGAGEYLIGMVTNSLHVAGVKNFLGKDISLDDGKFEVILIKRPQNLLELNSIISAVAAGKLDSEFIDYFKTDDVTIKCQTGLSWTLDGENGGTHTESKISCLRKALTVKTGEN